MRKALLAVLTIGSLSLAGLGGGLAYAKGGDHMERRMHHLAEELELSESQKEQLSQHFKGKFEQMQASKKTRQEFHSSLMQLDPKAADYDKQLDTLVKQAQADAKNRVMQKAEAHKTLATILTPAQLTEFKQLKQEKGHWKEKGKHHRGKHCD